MFVEKSDVKNFTFFCKKTSQKIATKLDNFN